MLVIRILALQAALVAAQLLNVTDVPAVGDVLGGLLGGGGGTTTTAPDVVAVPDPVVTPEPSTPVVDEPEVVDIPETVPAPVEVTPEPSPEPTPEPVPEPTPEPAVVVPPVVVVPTPEPAPVVPQQQPPANSPAAPAPAATAPAADAPPAAVFVPPPQQQPAAAPPAAASSPAAGSGAGGVILASPSAANVAPAPNPATTASPGMSVFVPPAVAAAAAIGTTTLDSNGDPILPTPGPSPDGSVAQDIPSVPNANTNSNPDLTNDQVTKEESDGGMPNGTKIAVGVAGGAGGVVVLVVVFYVFWKRRMRRSAWRKKLEGPGSGGEQEAKFNVAGSGASMMSGSDGGGKVEWVETRGHDVTFDFGFEKEEARIAHGRGGSASGFSARGLEKDVEAGYRVELEGDSPPVSRGR